MKIQEAIAEALVAEGVEVVFGLIAGGIDSIISNLVDVRKIRYVQARHEEAAIGMADGYARASGKIGVAIIDGGPGLANACAPMLAARMSGTRLLVVLSGDDSDRHTLDRIDRYNNMSIDQAPLLLATIGHFQAIRSKDTLADDVAQAFRHIRLGKGPTALTFSAAREVAADGVKHDPQMPKGWRYKPAPPPAPRLAGAPRPIDVETVARRMKESRRPLILAGRGAWQAGAKPALQALADRSGALLATTLLGKDMFAGDPFHLGVSGGFSIADAREVLTEADLVVAFGAQLNPYTTGHGQLYARATLVQVDISSDAFGEYQMVDQPVAADAKLMAEALLLSLERIDRPDWRGPAMASRISRFDRWRDRDLSEHPGKANIRRVVDALDRLAPKERMLLTDHGLFMAPPAAYVHVPDPDGIIFPWQLGRVGCGLAVAAGAAIGRKDRLMLAFIGDGGLMAGINALDTIASERLPVLMVIMDDSGYGADRHLFDLAGVRTSVAEMHTPNLVVIAQGYGIRAFKVTSGAEMEAVLRRTPLNAGPVLIHVVIDPTTVSQEQDAAVYNFVAPH